MYRFFLAICVFSLVTACQHSPKKNYYYLTSAASVDRINTTDNNKASQLIGIGPIEIPEYLTRSQIIDNQTDNRLVMAENAYWAEPLDKSITRVIALNLTALNGARTFVNFPWRNDSKPLYSVRIHIDDLSRSQGNAGINVTWELMDATHKSLLTRRNFTHSIRAENGAKGLAQAYSQLLAELSKEIDNVLNQHP